MKNPIKGGNPASERKFIKNINLVKGDTQILKVESIFVVLNLINI